ncbi:MAG: DUF1573 domain-containing protein [Bacteroidota bacterium]
MKSNEALAEYLYDIDNKNTNNMTMKKIIIILLTGLIAMTGFTQTNEESTEKSGPQISFDKKVHDYGKIKRKSNGTCTFTLTNEGSETLILTNVQTSCGCAAAKWPRKPIPAGESREIEIKYDTRRTGNFSKTIKVYNNVTEKPVILSIKGQVTK